MSEWAQLPEAADVLAAMGCDEILIHGWDLSQGLGFDFTPTPVAVERRRRA